MSDDENIMVLAPLGWNHTPHSVEIDAACGHRCWISPTSLAVVLDGSMAVRTTCLPCSAITPQKLAEMGAAGIAKMAPGQREELNDLMGEGVTTNLLNRFNITDI